MNIFFRRKTLFRRTKKIKLEGLTDSNLVRGVGFGHHLFLVDVLNGNVWNIDLKTCNIFTFTISPPFNLSGGNSNEKPTRDWCITMGRCAHICISKDLYLGIISFAEGRVYLYSPEGKKECEFISKIEENYIKENYVFLPRKIFFDSRNNIGISFVLISKRPEREGYVEGHEDCILKIEKYSISGEKIFESTPYKFPQPFLPTPPITLGYTLITDNCDNIYLAFKMSPYLVLKFSSAGQFLDKFTRPIRFKIPVGIIEEIRYNNNQDLLFVKTHEPFTKTNLDIWNNKGMCRSIYLPELGFKKKCVEFWFDNEGFMYLLYHKNLSEPMCTFENELYQPLYLEIGGLLLNNDMLYD